MKKLISFGLYVFSCRFLVLHLQPSLAKFEPYSDNGGTIVGLAGSSYCIVACDTRLSDQFLIRSRNHCRVFELSGASLFAASGCTADSLELLSSLQHNVRIYQWQSSRKATVCALSHLLASTLYSRRTFPFFSFCALAGLDKDGHGALYRYDAIGSFERVPSFCVGKGERLIQPLLDNVRRGFYPLSKPALDCGSPQHSVIESSDSNSNCFVEGLTVDAACNIILKAFQAAAEREITVGDGLEMFIIRKRVADCTPFFAPRAPTGIIQEALVTRVSHVLPHG
jgi:20S proteasome subunit beta 6